MADDKQQTPAPAPTPDPVKPYTFNESAFKSKVTTIEKDMDSKAGKANYNPYHWAKLTGFTDAVKRFKLGERSKELFDIVDKLPSEVPCIDPDYIEPEEPQKPALPPGLRPPVKK